MTPANYTILFSVLLAAVTAALLTLFLILNRRTAPGVWWLALAMAATAVWSGAYAMELMAPLPVEKITWAKIEYIGIPVLAPAWFLFVLSYSGQEALVMRARTVILWIIPAITLVLAWTNEVHELIWREVMIDPTHGGFGSLTVEHGTWFWVFAAYTYLLLFVGVIVVVPFLGSSRGQVRRQAVALLVGMLPVWVANVIYVIPGQAPIDLDLTPIAFAFGGLVYTVGVLNFRMLDIMPVAYHAVVAGLSDAVIIGDDRDRLAELNAAAQRLFAQPLAELIGQPLRSLLPDVMGLVEHYRADQPPPLLKRTTSQGERVFELEVAPLGAVLRKPLGSVIVLHDITERHMVEQALHALNQSLEERVRNRTQALEEQIAERLDIEAALRASETRNRAILNAIPDLIFRIADDGTFLDFRPVDTVELYLPAGQFLGKKAADVMPAPAARQLAGTMAEARRSGKLQTLDYELEMAGRVRAYEARVIISGENDYMVIVRDVTTRKETERQLVYLAGLLDNVSDAVISTDLDFRIRSWNQAATELYGYSLDEAQGTPVGDLLRTEYVETDAQEAVQHFRQHGSWRGEVIQYHKNGSSLYVWSSVAAVSDHSGKVIGAVAVNRDVTASRLAHLALEASENRYRELVETTHDIIQSVAPDGSFLFVNRAWFDRFGYEGADLAHLRLWDVVHPDEHAYCERLFSDLKAGLPQAPVTITFVTKGGELISLEGTVIANFEDGQFISTYSFLRDITERVKAETALRRAEERYRHLFEDAPVMYVLTGGPTGAPLVTDCNQLFLDTLGYARNEVIGRPLADFYTAKSRHQLFLGGYQRALDGVFGIEERQLLTRDNRVVETLLRTSPETDAVGTVIGTRGMFVDISERKRVENRLHQTLGQLRALTHRLEQVREEERVRISREIHDQLGQLLSALKIDVAWLGKRLPSDDLQLQHKTTVMLDLLSDAIRSVQRISSELRPGMLDDLGLAAAIEWQAHEFEKRTGIVCTVDVSIGEDHQLNATLSTALYRIFQEALTNVARHAQATEVEIQLSRETDAIRLSVRDNGIGMQRYHLTSTRSLGLLGMRERLYPWHGTLDIRSEPGQGTVVEASVALDHLQERPFT